MFQTQGRISYTPQQPKEVTYDQQMPLEDIDFIITDEFHCNTEYKI